MSHEALHNTKVEYEKQKKDMNDVNSSISKLEELRDKDQKILNSKKSRKVELEAKLTKNTQDLKKPDADKNLLNQEKTQIENELAEVERDIPIYTSIVEDYNEKIQKLKKGKDVIEPKLASAKKESVGERIGHFTKKNWKALTAAVVASTILAGVGGYEYKKYNEGKENDKAKGGNEKPVPVVPPKDTSKDTTAHFRDGNKDNRDHRDQRGNRDRSDKPSKPKEKPSKENVDKTPGVVYRITNPDKTKDTTFKEKKERDAFIKDHNLILNESNTTVPSKKNETLNVEWKLTSPDGKQTKTFATKAERDAFAREHNLQVKEN